MMRNEKGGQESHQAFLPSCALEKYHPLAEGHYRTGGGRLNNE